MTSSIKDSSACSPDSTVSSLLTSCVDSSHSCSDSLIHYKDKLYSSASEALEAYIEDFDLSLTSSEKRTGKICVCQSTPKQVKFSKRHAKEKRGSDDFTQRVGLASLASPRRRQTERDLDSISLATDDLLALPADGLLPFVQHTPLKSRHRSSEWNRGSLKTPFCPSQTPSVSTESGFSLQENRKAVAPQNPHKDFRKKKRNDRCGSVSSNGSSRPLSSEENCNASPVKNYPRWLTSQKSDLSVSGITSIPNFHYPAWLRSYRLFSDSTKSDGQNFNIQGKASSSQTLDILKKRHSVDKASCNFFERNGCLGPRGAEEAEESYADGNPDACFQFDNVFSRHTKKPFSEDQPELLTLKGDRGLESSTEDLSNTLENSGSPSTTEILGAERSWENAPAAFNPPAPVRCEDVADALPFPKADIIQKFLQDCLNDKNKANVFSGGRHHRPLEALKLMLFKLQGIQGNLSRNETAEQEEEFVKVGNSAVASAVLQKAVLLSQEMATFQAILPEESRLCCSSKSCVLQKFSSDKIPINSRLLGARSKLLKSQKFTSLSWPPVTSVVHGGRTRSRHKLKQEVPTGHGEKLFNPEDGKALEQAVQERLSEKAEAELKLYDSEIIPLTNSIQKALHHLSRLKSLVEDNSHQQEQTNDHEEDKQEEKEE